MVCGLLTKIITQPNGEANELSEWRVNDHMHIDNQFLLSILRELGFYYLNSISRGPEELPGGQTL